MPSITVDLNGIGVATIKLADHGLGPGDMVNAKFKETGERPGRGKTIAELYPAAGRSPGADLSIGDEMTAEPKGPSSLA